MNISGIVVKISKNKDEVISKIEKIDGCEFHLSDEANTKLIFTIEAKSLKSELNIVQEIQKIESVMSVDITYSYAKDELEASLNKIQDSPKVSNILDDKTKAEDIRYGGSVYNAIERSE